MQSKHRRRDTGSISIEFTLVMAFFFLPLLLGVFTLGFDLMRGIEQIQFTRDSGHMYADGVNFATQGNQNLLAAHLAQNLDIRSNSGNVTGGTTGNGVVVLSTFTNLNSALCGGCPNASHTVLMRRVIIGNKSIFTTQYGSPAAALVDPATGDIKNYTTDPSARADNFGVIALASGGIAYFVETYFAAPDLGVSGFFNQLGVYSSAVF